MRSRGARSTAPPSAALGFITAFETRDGWRRSPLNQRFFKGATGAAERHGYRLEEFWIRDPKVSSQRLSQILHTRNVPGLLIAPMPRPEDSLQLEWDKFAVVALGYSLASPAINRAVDQQFHSMRLALQHLHQLGYRRPGLAVRAALNESVHNHWAAGMLVEQQARSPSEHVPLFVVSDQQWNESSFTKWYVNYRPDVILGLDEEILTWLLNWGLGVPEDVGFVHLECPNGEGRFAGIRRNGVAVGMAAIDLLVGMIHRNERGVPALPKWILVESRWQDGATLRCASNSPAAVVLDRASQTSPAYVDYAARMLA
jgi:LacI family transcriptional regulator